MTNTTNTTNTAQARMPEFHFARLLHDDPLAIRSQWRSGDSVRREVQGRLLLDLSRDTVLAVHEAPMALAAVDTYLATLAAHHARCEEIDARADE